MVRSHGKGRKAVNYKLRDWHLPSEGMGRAFSIVWVDGLALPLPEEQLPLLLPETSNFNVRERRKPAREFNRLADDHRPDQWGAGSREKTDASVGRSCWYYLRFLIRRIRTGSSIRQKSAIG